MNAYVNTSGSQKLPILDVFGIATLGMLGLVFAAPLSRAVAADFGDTLILGDSITQGALVGNHQSYRYELWKQLIDGGDAFDLVGSQSNSYNFSNTSDTVSTSTYPDYLGHSFDTDHEGHWGWRATDVLGTTSPSLASGSGTGNLSNWLADYTADTALILIGVNDVKISVGASVSDTKANVQTLIGNLKADNPAVDVFLGSVLPSASSFADQSILQALNLEYQNIAVSDPAVTYVDLWTDFSVGSHLYDGVHPNVAGERLVASRFYNAMTTAIPEPGSLVLLMVGSLGALSSTFSRTQRVRKSN